MFKLLAVLMFFSALATGSITVHANAPEGSVAQIGEAYYTNLADAITEANTAATTTAVEIDLLASVEYADALIVNNNVTLDLNGWTLNATGGISVITGGNVVDNSEGNTGFLEVESEKCVFAATNTQMPVYNGTNGYVFATMVEQVHRMSDEGADTFELIFKPYFGTSTINALLANGGKDAHVSIGIRLEYTDANGKTQTKDLVYTDEMVKSVYGGTNMAFYIRAAGVTSFAELTITPLVKSNVGSNPEWSKSEYKESAYQRLMLSCGEAIINEDFTSYTAESSIPTSTKESNYTFFVKSNDSGNKIQFANDDDKGTCIWMNEPGINAFFQVSESRVSDAKEIVFECDVKYKQQGLNFQLRGNVSSTMCTFGTIYGGKFTPKDSAVSTSLTQDEWYKITYKFNLEEKKFDTYLNEKFLYTGSFDSFSGFGGSMRFYIKDVSSSVTGEDIWIDNIKFYKIEATE